MLPRFEVLEPATVEEACRILALRGAEGARILAGGTDLLVDIRRPILPPHGPPCPHCLSTGEAHPARSSPAAGDPSWARPGPSLLISIGRIVALRGVREEEGGGVVVGSLTTMTEIEGAPAIRRRLTALAEAAGELGSPLVRNRGTLGGNLANARPAADTAVATIALGGEVELVSALGSRCVPAAEFPTGPGSSLRHPDELITFVRYPGAPPRSGSAFVKLAQRRSLEIAVVNVASAVTLDGPGGGILDARICLGAVGPRPLLAWQAMAHLLGRVPEPAALAEAGRLAREDARAIDDFRASREYRLEMIEVLVRRTLERAVERAMEAGDRPASGEG